METRRRNDSTSPNATELADMIAQSQKCTKHDDHKVFSKALLSSLFILSYIQNCLCFLNYPVRMTKDTNS